MDSSGAGDPQGGRAVCGEQDPGRSSFKQDILEKLKTMEEKVDLVEQRSPEILEEYREKLEGKVKELLADTQIEESRIAAEVILFADKICTDEETVRLKSHIQPYGGSPS